MCLLSFNTAKDSELCKMSSTLPVRIARNIIKSWSDMSSIGIEHAGDTLFRRYIHYWTMELPRISHVNYVMRVIRG